MIDDCVPAWGYAIRGLRFSRPRRGGMPASDVAGPPILDIPALDVPAGQCLALRGPNGSGKTTLLKLLDGLLVPDPGSRVQLVTNGVARTVRAPAAGARASVYLHQHPYLITGTVAANVGLACRAGGLSRAVMRERVGAALDLVGLTDFAHRPHHALSGGEIQRVALARAVAARCPILLLDEPTSSVDSTSQVQIRRLLARLKAAGHTLVIASHDDELVTALADRILELRDGRVAEALSANGAPA